MSQLPPASQLDILRSSRNELEEVYKEVNRHFEELHPLPKQFIEQTTPAIDKYLQKFSKPGAADDLFVFQALMGFLNQFDDFALMANEVFSEYDEDSKTCKEYLDKISDLEQLFKDNSSGDLNSIAPSITEMSNRMNNIKIRSDEMVKKLETIETRWKKIKTKIGT